MNQFVARSPGRRYKRKGCRRYGAGLLFGERATCENCGRVLLHSATVGRRRNTCSDKCRQQLCRDQKILKDFFDEGPSVTKCRRACDPEGVSQLLARLRFDRTPNVR